MAVLGAQLVFSLIILSFLQKLSPYFSFGRWLICNKLVRYLHPTDESLRKAAGISHGGGRGKGKQFDNKKNVANGSDFTVPRSIDIDLDTAKVELSDLVHLRYFPDYQWLMDFCVSAFIVYILTEIYYALGPRTELNMSMLWCLLAVGFCLRILFQQTSMYFTTKGDGWEMILCFLFGFFFLVSAMGILVVDESILEFGLESGYKNFSEGAQAFLKLQGIESQGPVSLLTFKIILALLSALVGALLTFPGLRYGRLHISALKYSQENYFKQVILHLNFILPVVILFLWVKPIARQVICATHWKSKYKVLGEAEFESIRILLFSFLLIIRLLLMPMHLQGYLNMAYENIENMRKESGRISALELQRSIARIFYYLCVVGLQYITPVLLLFFLSLMQKTLGEYSWSATFGESFQTYISSFSESNVAASESATTATSNNATATYDSIAETAAQFSWALTNLRQIFSSHWYRGLFAYLTWWVCASWFTTSAFGAYYVSTLTAN
ncbi:hypothetical protein FSP39_020286 [Pinctada imbricata]|uniref:Transmembrane protein 161B n=1 Tax=Pinctada imbricata TaxID=66713 RepID=A0AA89C443_PINIB|nr:hypothetical protein FSP39_020286 [Pinctada imbricata]